MKRDCNEHDLVREVGESLYNGYIDGIKSFMRIFGTKEEAEKYKEFLRKLFNKEEEDERKD